MTQTEGNGDSNRRQSQVKTVNQKKSNSEREALAEDSGGKSSENKEKSVSGGSTGKSISGSTVTMKIKGNDIGMGLTEEGNDSKTGQAIDGLARNQDDEESARLSQIWPTPKESVKLKRSTQNSSGADGSLPVTGPTTNGQTKDQTQLINVKEKKKKKPSYPIFHRQRRVGLISGIKPNNSNNAPTMVPVPTPVQSSLAPAPAQEGDSKPLSQLQANSTAMPSMMKLTSGSGESTSTGDLKLSTNPNKFMTMAPAAVVAASIGAATGITRNGATAVAAEVDKAKGTKPSSRGKIPTVEGNKSPGNMENNSTAMVIGSTPNLNAGAGGSSPNGRHDGLLTSTGNGNGNRSRKY
jgi:hypothetical protein